LDLLENTNFKNQFKSIKMKEGKGKKKKKMKNQKGRETCTDQRTKY
jgi:hypothetical protein